MNASHIHLAVSDLKGTLDWLDRVWQLRPTLSIAKMACVPFGNVVLVLDAGDADTRATIAFHSENCDADFERMKSRGAEPVSSPVNQPYGVRVAYIKGPGALTFEIEQAIPRTQLNPA